MKAYPRYVDGRLDQVARNRMNMFADLGFPIPDSTVTVAPPPERPTKHGRTPYTYSTAWISHPDAGSGLESDEMTMRPQTQTGWVDKMVATGHEDKSRHINSVYNAIRYHETKYDDLVTKTDSEIKAARELNWSDIRAQRAAHLKALEIRQRLEKIKSYD
jgi:hypothetical protein